MDGPCISLADVPESRAILTENPLGNFEELYRSITAKVNSEVDAELGQL
jgi:hypothetical protein